MKKKIAKKEQEHKCWAVTCKGVPVTMTMFCLDYFSSSEAKAMAEIAMQQYKIIRPLQVVKVEKCSFKRGW